MLVQGNAAYRRGDAWVAADASFQRQDGVLASEDSPNLTIPDFASRLFSVRGGVRLGERVQLQARVRWIHDASDGRQDQIVPGLGTYRIDLPERTDRVAVRLAESIDLGRGSSVRFSVGRQWAFNTSTQDRYDSPSIRPASAAT